MGVNHYLLSITSDDLASLLETPERIRLLIEDRATEVCELGKDGVAIASLTATSADDPLAFLNEGAPLAVCGWIGKYVETGSAPECEVDMGYGPASYYRNEFIVEVARKLGPITVAAFAENCDLDWLESNCIYPCGWLQPGNKELLIQSFEAYRKCILEAAQSGRSLLVWCA